MEHPLNQDLVSRRSIHRELDEVFQVVWVRESLNDLEALTARSRQADHLLKRAEDAEKRGLRVHVTLHFKLAPKFLLLVINCLEVGQIAEVLGASLLLTLDLQDFLLPL